MVIFVLSVCISISIMIKKLVFPQSIFSKKIFLIFFIFHWLIYILFSLLSRFYNFIFYLFLPFSIYYIILYYYMRIYIYSYMHIYMQRPKQNVNTEQRDEIGVPVQSWLWEWVELMAWTEFSGRGFKSHSGQLSIATS